MDMVKKIRSGKTPKREHTLDANIFGGYKLHLVGYNKPDYKKNCVITHSVIVNPRG